MPRVSIGQAELATKPHALYRFYDATDVLLYVGITADLPTRISTHRKEKPWWTLVAHIRVEQFETRADALAAEAQAIREEKPLYNVTGNIFVATDDEALQRAIATADRITFFAAGEDYERYNGYLADAQASITAAAEDPDDDLDAWSEPILYAAERAVDDLTCENHSLMDMMRGLFRAHTYEIRRRATERALEARDRWPDYGSEAFRKLRMEAHFIAVEAAAAVLSNLEPRHATEWRIAATRALGREGNDDLIEIQAAEMYQQSLAGRTLTGMCIGPGIHIAQCMRRSTRIVWLRRCYNCEADSKAECEGHLALCERHYSEAEKGKVHRSSGEAYEIERSEFIDTEHDGTPIDKISRQVSRGVLTKVDEEIPF